MDRQSCGTEPARTAGPRSDLPAGAAAAQPGFCNIELKARLHALDFARDLARSLADREVQELKQVDTYFHCRQGRLKLREIEYLGSMRPGKPDKWEGQLIWYDRPELTDSKSCHFQLVRVSDSEVAKAALTAAWGVRAVVRKRREVYWHRNVRIHLDEVEQLGSFLELEAVLRSPEADAPLATRAASAEDAHRLLAELQQRFRIQAADLLSSSYGEMIGEA